MISSLLETLAGNAVPKPGYIRVWNDYPQAYLSTSWWQEHLASIVVGNADSDRRRAVIFNALIDVRYDAASNGVALVKEIQRLVAGPRREKVLFDAVVSAASFKDATSEGLLLASLAENITEEAYETWASSFPYFTEQHKLLGLKVMKQKLQGRGQEGNVISELIYRSKLIAADSRQVAARGPFLVSNIKSESREFVCEWAAEFSASLPAGTERLLLISRLVEAGGNGSETLVDALEGFAARGMIGDDDDWTWVVTALHALEQTDRHISTNAMLRLVRLFPNFPTHSFFSTLIRREGRRVTDQICKLFAEAGPSFRAQIFSGLEDVAQSLGIAASWDALNNLRLDWVD